MQLSWHQQEARTTSAISRLEGERAQTGRNDWAASEPVTDNHSMGA